LGIRMGFAGAVGAAAILEGSISNGKTNMEGSLRY
jgi:hypothetical protein